MLHITPWERSALQLLATGVTTAQLATDLGVPEFELQQQLIALFHRMGAASAGDAIAAACRRGLIPAVPTPGASRL